MSELVRNWWLFLITGILFLFTGVWVLLTPLASYITLSVLFGIIFFLAGITKIYFSISNKDFINGWGWYLTIGIIDFLLGILLVLHPEISMVTLPFLMSFWLMFKGTTLIGIALDIKKFNIPNWWILLTGGILTTLFAFFILFNPLIGVFTIVIWTGLSFLTAGLINTILSFKIKKLKNYIVE